MESSTRHSLRDFTEYIALFDTRSRLGVIVDYTSAEAGCGWQNLMLPRALNRNTVVGFVD
jgi:hypothetical protein